MHVYEGRAVAHGRNIPFLPILEVFRARVQPERLTALVQAFDDGRIVHTGDELPSADYTTLVADLPGVRETLADLGCEETPANVAAAVEFLLEGLHLSKRLNKDAVDGRATYRSRSGNR